jgi:hypothetical protein
MGDHPLQGRCLHTEQHKHRINTHGHPCLEWDTNPIPVVELAKMVREATVIGSFCVVTGFSFLSV